MKADESPYGQLASSIRSEIENQTRVIRGLLENTTRNIIQIGLRLQFVRSRIGRAGFQPWLRSEFQWSQPVASNYMAAARVFSDLDCVGKFQPSAMFVLARKKVPQAARDEAVQAAKQGERITKSRALELISKHRTGRKGENSEARQRVRRSIKNLLKQLPDEAAPEVISELLRIAEELRERHKVPAPEASSTESGRSDPSREPVWEIPVSHSLDGSPQSKIARAPGERGSGHFSSRQPEASTASLR